MHLSVLTDNSVHPDISGLPPSVVNGLQHLANNAAGLLMIVSGIGIGVSLIGWVASSFTNNSQLAERTKHSLGISVSAMALLYVAIAAANYAGRLFS